MVHKKYTYKDGKKFGPYYYETKRVHGKIITTYLGTNPPRRTSKRIVTPWLILTGFVFIALLIAGGYYFFGDNISNLLSGRSILEVDADYSGEFISGNAYLTLNQGELIPADSVVSVSYGQETREVSLSSLVDSEISEGDFYIKGAEISGSGSGYGIAGYRSFDTITFDFRVYDSELTEPDSSSGSGGGGGGGSETQEAGEGNIENVEPTGLDENVSVEEGETSEIAPEQPEGEENPLSDDNVEEPLEEPSEQIQEETIPSESESEESSESLESSESPESSDSSGITGSAISENGQIVSVVINRGESYSYIVEEGKSVELVSGSVYADGELQEDDLVDLEMDNGSVVVSFNDGVGGFGEGYTGDMVAKLTLDLAKLELPSSEAGDLKISILYNGAEIVSSDTSEQVPVEEPEILEIVPEANVTLNTTQFGAVLGEPVQWVKKISADDSISLAVELPASAENISIRKIEENVGETSEEREILDENVSVEETDVQEIISEENISTSEEIVSESELPHAIVDISGNVVSESLGNGFSLLEFVKKLVRPTGFVAIDSSEETVSVEINLTESEVVEISYTTPAPYAVEEELDRGKRVIIASPEDVHYENVLSFTTLDESLGIRDVSKIKIYWVENKTFVGVYSAEDTNENGLIDYVSWIAPHLSNQTFDIIVVTKAQHLDENMTFVSDIYDSVKELDDIWSEQVPAGHYVRVTFEHALTSEKDITIYPRVVNGTPIIQVYEVNGTEILTQFEAIESEEYNKVYLTNLQGEQDTFDLRVLGGDIEFDHIIDPVVVSNRQGIIVYGEGTVTTPRYRIWNGTAFGGELSASTANGCVGSCNIVSQKIVSSPTKDEYMLVTSVGETVASFFNMTQSIQFNSSLSGTNCWHNSTACDTSFTLNMVNTTTANVLRFSQQADIAYELSSGDSIVVYLQGNNTILYRTWSGGVLSDPSEVVQTALGGFIREVKLASNPVGGNEIALVYRNNSAAAAMIWDGSSWTCTRSTPLTPAISPGNFPAMDITYEQVSGDLFMAFASSARDTLNYTVKLNGSCTYTSAGTAAVGGTATASAVSLGAQYGSDNILIGAWSSGTVDDVVAKVWNGTALVTSLAADTSAYATDASGNLFIGTGWAGTHPNGVFMYSDAATNFNITYNVYKSNTDTWSSTFNTNASMVTPFSDEEVWFKLYSFIEENKTFAFVTDDSTGDLWAKLYNPATTNNWSNADDGAALETSGSATDQPHFDFTWNLYNTIFDIGSPVVTIVYPTNTTYYLDDLPLVFNITLDESGGTVAYSLDEGVNNFSMSSTNGLNYNATNESLALGSYTFRAYANDSNGNRNDTASVVFALALRALPINFTNFTSPSGYLPGSAIPMNVSSSTSTARHYVLTDFNKDLMLWVRMDDRNSSEDYIDLSSYSTNGSKKSSPVVNSTNGRFGNGTYFDGIDDAIIFSNTGGGSPYALRNASMWMWIKTTNAGSSYRGIGVKQNAFSLYLKNGILMFYDFTANADRTTTANLSDGNWYHVGLNFRSGVIQGTEVYIDGVVNLTTNLTISSDSSFFVIGAGDSAGSAQNFAGNIDEVIIFNRTLTSAEALALYNASANQYTRNFTGLPAGQYNFTAYAVDAAGNRNQTEQRSISVDPPAPAITFVSPTPSSGSSQTTNAIYVNVSSSDNLNHYTLTDFNRDLVMWIRFDETNSSGDPIDLSSWSNNGSLKNGAFINSSGYWGSGSFYDGINDYVRVNNSDSLQIDRNNFTLMAWVKTKGAISTYKMVLGKGSSGVNGYSLSLDSTGRADLGVQTSPSTATHIYSSSEVDDGNWHHIAVSVPRLGSAIFYIDGIANGTWMIAPYNESLNNSYPLNIGEMGLANFFWFNGSIDDAMVFQRYLEAGEVKAVYNATLTQYARNFTNLPSAQYNFTSYSVDRYGNLNSTEKRSVTVSDNTAPSITVLNINSTTGTNRTHEDLNCYGTITDAQSNTMNVSVRWYNDTTQRLQVDYNNSYASGTVFNAILDDGNTTKGQNWTCAVNLFDGVAYSGWFNSTTPNVTILNSPPIVPALSTPTDSSSTTDRTPTFAWSASTDNDTDSVTYELNVTLVAMSTCTDTDRYVTAIASTSHELAQELNCFYDNGDVYNWTARAYDGQSYSSWYAPPYRLNVTALIGITLLNATVDFGSINFQQSNDTTDNSPRPFLLQSDGNALVNVTIQATSLWQSIANPNSFYTFKIDNHTLENGSFRWGSSITSFTNMPLVGSPSIAIGYFNYTDVSDTAEIDIFIQVPSNEGAGARNSTVTLISSLI